MAFIRSIFIAALVLFVPGAPEAERRVMLTMTGVGGQTCKALLHTKRYERDLILRGYAWGMLSTAQSYENALRSGARITPTRSEDLAKEVYSRCRENALRPVGEIYYEILSELGGSLRISGANTAAR